jgi:hypothetical protein
MCPLQFRRPCGRPFFFFNGIIALFLRGGKPSGALHADRAHRVAPRLLEPREQFVLLAAAQPRRGEAFDALLAADLPVDVGLPRVGERRFLDFGALRSKSLLAEATASCISARRIRRFFSAKAAADAALAALWPLVWVGLSRPQSKASPR